MNTVVDRETEYTGIIGFTKEETNQFLNDYELGDFAQKVKDNYDGYKFYDKEMFCPWDVVNFIKKNFNFQQNCPASKVITGNYWATSTSSPAVYEYLGYLTDTDTQKMQDLVDGKSISFKLNDSMNYDCLSQHIPNDFWSLLLHTGYLTVDWDKTDTLNSEDSSADDIAVKLPNLEIKDCFRKNIQDRFNNEIAPNTVADELATSLLNGDSIFAQTKLRSILMRFISIRDNATKAPHENYYHGYLNGLFTNCSKNFFTEYQSNSEAGDGYADIAFTDAYSEKAVIIEIKTTTDVSNLPDLSNTAIEQIKEKHYADKFIANKMVQSIYAYGIAFAGKNCVIAVMKIK